MASITLSPHHAGVEIVAAIYRVAVALLVPENSPRLRPGIVFQAQDAIPQVSDWLAGLSSDPAKVRAFCDQHKIMTSAVAAERMARESFPAGSEITFAVEQDPESDAEWLAIDVRVKDGSDALACYNKFIAAWVSFPNTEARQLINLTFSST